MAECCEDSESEPKYNGVTEDNVCDPPDKIQIRLE